MVLMYLHLHCLTALLYILPCNRKWHEFVNGMYWFLCPSFLNSGRVGSSESLQVRIFQLESPFPFRPTLFYDAIAGWLRRRSGDRHITGGIFVPQFLPVTSALNRRSTLLRRLKREAKLPILETYRVFSGEQAHHQS